jgi:hypothetical protein
LIRREVVVFRLRQGTKARYGNEHYQSVVYANHFNIMLGRAQSVKKPLEMYIIIRNYFVVEKVAILSRYTWWGGPHAYTGHLPINYVTRAKATR